MAGKRIEPTIAELKVLEKKLAIELGFRVLLDKEIYQEVSNKTTVKKKAVKRTRRGFKRQMVKEISPFRIEVNLNYWPSTNTIDISKPFNVVLKDTRHGHKFHSLSILFRENFDALIFNYASGFVDMAKNCPLDKKEAKPMTLVPIPGLPTVRRFVPYSEILQNNFSESIYFTEIGISEKNRAFLNKKYGSHLYYKKHNKHRSSRIVKKAKQNKPRF